MTPAFLEPAFMQRALLAAVLVGLVAPSVGTYLVARRLALLGDGIGHVALTGVAIGFLVGGSRLAVPAAVVVASLGALVIEVVRSRGRASGDIALAMLFYGGIAGGVLLIGLSASGSSATLLSFLFGSITTVAPGDLLVIAVLAFVVLGVTLGLRRPLFSICQDEDFARVSGLPVAALNTVLAVTAAVTVTVAMRVVGLLLVSALMVVPVATAQQVTRGFRATMWVAMVLGVAVSVAGVVVSFYADVASGAAIVLISIALFFVTAGAAAWLGRRVLRAPDGDLGAVAEDDLALGR